MTHYRIFRPAGKDKCSPGPFSGVVFPPRRGILYDMVEQPPVSSAPVRRVYVPVVSAETELASAFVDSVRGDAGTTIHILHCHVSVDAFDGAKIEREMPPPEIARSDAFVLLAHFLDHGSIDTLQRLYHRLRFIRSAPLGLFIFRNEGEHQFKISCPECGQKLWVSEEEIGMRGRCVNCRQIIPIRSPAEMLRQRLSLPDSVPVLNVTRGNTAGCRGALANLVARALTGVVADRAANPVRPVSEMTMPIQVAGDSAPARR